MKCNVGKTDRWIRIILGVILLIIGFYYQSWLWGIIGLIVLLTGIFRFCVIYKLFGISTCDEKPNSQTPSQPQQPQQ